MKILVDASSLRAAGGLAVGRGICSSLRELHSENTFLVLAPEGIGYEEFAGKNIRVVTLPRLLRSGGAWLFKNAWIHRKLRHERPDAILSLCNFALVSKVPQLLLLHWAYAIYPDSPVWQRMPAADRVKRRFRSWIFRRRFHYATAITVQSANMAERLVDQFGIPPERVFTVPSAVTSGAPGDEEGGAAIVRRFRGWQSNGLKVLIYITRYYDHKNLEVLLEVAELSRDRGGKFRIITTVAADQSPRADRFLKEIADRGLDEWVINVGPVSPDTVPGILRAADGTVIPTLLESFGISYLEAMEAGCPIFTSDLDFAHSVCGNAAFYFDPLDAESVFECVESGLQEPDALVGKVAEGRRLFGQMPTWLDVTRRYLEILENREGFAGRLRQPKQA